MRGHRLILALILSTAALHGSHAFAQTPNPLLDRRPSPLAEECGRAVHPLLEDAEKKGKMIKAARDRYATPEEACELIGQYSEAEARLIRYVEGNAAKCGIQAGITDQLRTGHKKTEAYREQVCTSLGRKLWPNPPTFNPKLRPWRVAA